MKDTRLITLLSNLRLPLILGVIFIHSDLLEYLPEDGENLTAFRGFMDVWMIILNMCVPAFFFISGYLFFRDGLLTRRLYLQKLKRRWWTLAVPYILWNLLALILDWIKTLPPLSSHFPEYQGVFTSFSTIIGGFYELPHTPYPYDFPLWFLRDLIVIVVCTPILSLLFRYLRQFTPLLILAIALCFPDLPELFRFPLFFFTLGSSASIYNLKQDFLYKRPFMLTLMLVAAIALSTRYQNDYLWVVTTIIGITWFIAMAEKFSGSENSKLATYGEAIFFIYACHGLYATVVRKILLQAISPIDSSLKAFISYFAVFAVNVVITLLFYLVCKRVSSRLTSILTGGR